MPSQEPFSDPGAEQDGESRPQPTVIVARQPIFDGAESVCGYELLYRPLAAGLSAEADPEGATAKVIVGGLLDIGLDRLVGRRPAYINVTRELLLAIPDLPLPPDRVVLELLEDQLVDDALLESLRRLTEAGFRLALDDFVHKPGTEQALGLASIVKLDVQALEPAALREHVTAMKALGKFLIAEKVESNAEYAFCKELGFDAFQGYYFARPTQVSGVAAPTERLRTLAPFTGSGVNATFEQLEELITSDAGLSHRFLRLVSSAYFGPRRPVRSIHEGLARLGSVAVHRWILLLLVSGLGDDGPAYLLTEALGRARLCETLARRLRRGKPDRAFTVGLLSHLDAMLNQPMADIVAEIHVDSELSGALRDRAGAEGRLLDAVVSYERGEFDAAAATLGAPVTTLAGEYPSALEWSDRASGLVS